MKGYCTLGIDVETKMELKKLKKQLGEESSYNDIIKHLLNYYRERKEI